MGILTCPVCRARLERKDKSFVCSRGHSFDLSASGYLHLLPSSQMRSKVPGDNRQMVQARRNFLQKGYYQPISDALNRQLLEHCKKNVPLQILDAGCGEGYYTNRLAQFLGKEQPDFPHQGGRLQTAVVPQPKLRCPLPQQAGARDGCVWGSQRL
ncbi:MAG: putative RNA methyltransferase [Negativibacillus sp.]